MLWLEIGVAIEHRDRIELDQRTFWIAAFAFIIVAIHAAIKRGIHHRGHKVTAYSCHSAAELLARHCHALARM